MAEPPLGESLGEHRREYAEDEWPAIEATSFSGVSTRQLQRILMRWTWAERARMAWVAEYEAAAAHGDPIKDDHLWTESGWYFFLHLWLALVWALIEALTIGARPPVAFGGGLGEDVTAVGLTLRRARNATLHIPDEGRPYPDQRLSTS